MGGIDEASKVGTGFVSREGREIAGKNRKGVTGARRQRRVNGGLVVVNAPCTGAAKVLGDLFEHQ